MALNWRFIVLAFTAAAAARLSHLPLPAPAFKPASDIAAADQPQPSAFEGAYATNDQLTHAKRLFDGQVNGSESLAFAGDGSLFLLERSGLVLQASATESDGVPVLHSAPVAHVGGGRPLGAHFDTDGNLIFCHPPTGLMMLEAGSRRPVLLTSHVGALPALGQGPADRLKYPNDLDIAGSGKDAVVYFTDSGDVPPAMNVDGYYDTLWGYILSSLQGGRPGRLLSYSMKTHRTQVVADGLWFPNGVALSADGRFAAVVETVSMRVRRVWLSGPQAGKVDTLIDQLPGHPDGISRAEGGGFWLAIVAPKQPILQAVLRLPRALRAVVAHILTLWRPPLKDAGLVVKISEAGEPLEFLMDATGAVVSGIASVVQHGRRLYFGNLSGRYVSYLDLPSVASTA